MNSIESGREQPIRSGALKSIPEISSEATYVTKFRPDGNRVVYNLIEGNTFVIPPVEFRVIQNDLVLNGSVDKADRNYRVDNLERAAQNVRERFNNFNCDVFWQIGGINKMLYDHLALLQPGTKILALGPGFPEFPLNVDRYNAIYPEAKLEYVPVEPPLRLTMDESLAYAQEFRKKINSDKVLHYICLPGNPKGDKASVKAIDEFSKFTFENGDMQWFDEAGFDVFPDQESTVRLTKNHPYTEVFKGFSKTYKWPGKRIGYVVASKGELSENIKKLQVRFGMPVSDQMLINLISNNDILVPHAKKVASAHTSINRRLIPVLEDSGYEVFPTALETPFLTIASGVQGFADRLSDLSLGAVSGLEYARTHNGMDSSMIRLGIPEKPKRISPIVGRLTKARDEALRSGR